MKKTDKINLILQCMLDMISYVFFIAYSLLIIRKSEVIAKRTTYFAKKI